MRTFGHIFLKGDKWCIDKLEPHVCIRVKQIFPMIGATEIVPFYFPNKADTSADLHWFLQRYPLEISAKDRQVLVEGNNEYYQALNEIEKILLPNTKFPDIKFLDGLEPRHYQTVAYHLHKKVKRFLVGDDIGLGKTLVGMMPLIDKENIPAAIVVQTHLAKQWKEEIKRFFGLHAHIIQKVKPYSLHNAPAPVYIFKYSNIRGWVDVFNEGFFKYVCFDEVQEFRHSDTDKYRAGKILSNSAKMVMGLSATPIYNYGGEIWTVMNLLKTGCLGTFNQFATEWCSRVYKKGKLIVDDPQALGTYLRESHLMLRRTRKDVGRELPPINRIVFEVEHSEKDAMETIEFAKRLAIRVTTGSFVERGQAALELDVYLRMQTGVAKARGVAAFVKILLDNGETVLLSGWHREVYKIWMQELAEYNPVLYTGSESPAQKQKAKDSFVNGESKLFIISNRSGIGLDGLQHVCKTVVVGELDWSPKVHDQIIGRIDRDGQADQVTVFFPTCDFGSDPLIVQMLGLKATQSHNITNPDSPMEDVHTDEGRIKKMAEQFLKMHTPKELFQDV